MRDGEAGWGVCVCNADGRRGRLPPCAPHSWRPALSPIAAGTNGTYSTVLYIHTPAPVCFERPCTLPFPSISQGQPRRVDVVPLLNNGGASRVRGWRGVGDVDWCGGGGEGMADPCRVRGGGAKLGCERLGDCVSVRTRRPR